MFRGAGTGEIKIPQTIPAGSVKFWNIALFVLIWAILLFPLGWFWSTFFTLLGFAGAITFGVIAVDIPDFHGTLVFDPLIKKRRVIFPGLNFKLPWESVEDERTNLKRVVSSKGVDNHPTNDPAENMEVSLTLHIRVNVSGTPKEAEDNFIRFRSIEEDALTTIVRKEVIKMLQAHYSNQEMEQLTDANAVQEAIFPTATDNLNTLKIKEMEARWGISIGIVLDSSNPDAATKNMKRTPAMAEALRTARQKLMENKVDAAGTVIDQGMTSDEARRAALLLDPNSDYTERKFSLDVVAPDLKNLTHVSILGGLGDEGKKGKK